MSTGDGRSSTNYQVDDKDPLIVPFLVTRPHLAWYVKRLIIHNERLSFRDWQEAEDTRVTNQYRVRDEGLKCPDFFIAESLDIIRKGLQNSGLVIVTEEDAWLEEIKKGMDAPLKVLLLSLAPNIQTLVISPGRKFVRYWSRTSFIHFFGRSIHKMATMPTQVRPKVFPALKEVRLLHQARYRYYGEYVRLTSHEIAPLFMLPALENLFIGTHMTYTRAYEPGGDYHVGNSPFQPRASFVSCLYVENFKGSSSTEPIKMIKGIKALKSFQIKRPERNFHIYLQALLQNHAETLEELNLGVYLFSITDIASLAEFRALKSLSMEVGLLYNILKAKQKKGSKSKWKLGTILPTSLERLRIVECQVQHLQPSLKGFVSGLADFVDCKMTTHRSLRAICIGTIKVD
jgi:hypothetical protein